MADYRRLVEDGKYTIDELSENSKKFIEGMNYAMECVDAYRTNIEDMTEDDTPVIRGLKREIAGETITNIMDWLYTGICEQIVCLVEEDDNGK